MENGAAVGPNEKKLKAWLINNRPEIADQLTQMPYSTVRVVLNKETGLDIPKHGFIEDGCAKYLEAFKAQQ